MSIYCSEGGPKMGILAEDIASEFGATCAYELNSLTVTLPGVSKLPICTIRLARQPFCVRIEAPDGSVANRDTYSSIIARVRELAEAAREKPKEEAPQPEPALREFLVEFRKWLREEGDYEDPSDGRLADWIDARLGKEESDG